MSADCMQNLCFVETSQELEPKKGSEEILPWSNGRALLRSG